VAGPARRLRRLAGVPPLQVEIRRPLNAHRLRLTEAGPTTGRRMNAASLKGVSIVLQPSSRTAAAGQSLQFTVAATGTPAPTYQWQVSTNAGSS
jgi:hypothetical protein